jgi:TRAP-type C4-dicarboxylate transport system permease small subunit
MKFVKTLDDMIEKGVSYLLVSSVLTILFLSVLVIVLRWFSISFSWYDPLVRHLVFLTAFLGGSIATGRGTNIAIDVVGRYLDASKNESIKDWIERFILLVSLGTLLWLIKAGIEFCKVELEYGSPTFWGIHSGVLVGIIPVGFGIISIRLFLRFIKSFEGEE